MFVFSKTTQDRIIEGVCYLFVLLFVYAAVSKLLDFNTFQNQLGQSPLLSAYAHWVVWLVPAMEILIALALVIPRYRKLGLYGFFSMMVMFTTYIFIILNFADFVPCSCGGILEELGWTAHLFLNLGFVVLAIISILFISHDQGIKLKRALWGILGLAIVSIASVSFLYLGSEKQMKRNNAFVRRYIPHPTEKIGEYDLAYNSYYIAGIDDTTIYLGNITAPFLIKSLTHDLNNSQDHVITIDSTEIFFKRIRIAVQPPYFYVGDGTVPVIFRGKVNEWKATTYSYGEAFFTQFIVPDTTLLGISTLSSKTKSNALGVLQKSIDTATVILNTDILKTAMHSKFVADGMLLWNKKHAEFIYPYYYRSLFEVANKSLVYQYTGNTIDTVKTPQLDIAYYQNEDVYKRGKSVIVNRQASTYGDYLYIHSDRLGRYEDDEPLVSASIIDVYDITDNSYAFSFYLYHQPRKKLREFRIYKDQLIALVGNTLWLYKLKPRHFDPGFK